MHEGELQLEATTMALYVAVVLLATLTALSHHALDDQPRVLAVVWGTSIGLALAHIFAFTVASTRFLTDEPERRLRVIGAQLAGAAFVAVIATVPVLFLPRSAELDVDRVILGTFIGLSGYRVSRAAGRSRAQSAVVAAFVLLVGVGVALLKNMLGGH